MNKYTCSKCGQVTVVPSREEKLVNVKCTCGSELVTLLRGVVDISKPAPKNVVAPTMAKGPAPAPKPQPPAVFNPSATAGTVQQPKSLTGAALVASLAKQTTPTEVK
jgi:DNA-directed RNA polymerase subunit RPC12/RpoP